MKECRYSKILFLSILGINFGAILIYNFLTPPMSDDLFWNPGKYVPMSEILRDSWAYYNNWLGRIESYFFTRVMNAYPKPIYNVISSVFFVTLIIVLYCNIEREEKYDCRLLSLISLYIWIFGIDFAQTMLWVCGTCNYLWCLAIEFGFLAYFRHLIKYQAERRYNSALCKKLLILVMFIWGLLAGDGNESASGGVFLLVLFFALESCLGNRDKSESIIDVIRKNVIAEEISGILGFAIGIIIMVLAPGNRIRGAVSASDENQTGLLRYLGRFIKINEIVYNYMSVLIVTLVVLLVYIHLYHRKRFRDLINIYAYIVVAIVSIYVIILTTIPMPRAFMGGSLILLLGCMQLIQYIRREDTIFNTLSLSLVVLMFIYMLNLYISDSANLVRILRELNIRQEYVDEQKAQGNLSLELPMLREEWNNRFTYIYHNNDISEDPNSFGNKIYRIYYDLDEVRGIPWEEWEEKVQ